MSKGKDDDACGDRCPKCGTGRCVKAFWHFGQTNHVGDCGHSWK